jgi:hypothetical protein
MSFPENLSQIENPELILPPFLGELGYEVRSFIAMIEPWLRTGWKLPTRRPALYPEGTTLTDSDFFSRIDKIRENYKCEPIMSHLAVHFGENIRIEDLNKKKEGFSKDLQKIVRDYVDRPGRPVTYWDAYLVKPWSGINVDFFSSFHGLLPSYKPKAFLEGHPECSFHIGVQFRNMKKMNQRNSDIVAVRKLADEVAHFLELPLICYGEESGCFIPSDLQHVSQFYPTGEVGLSGDLRCLSRCVIMIAPDSGWADLMGWLQIPTILQKIFTPFSFYASYSHGATFGLMEPDQPIGPQVIGLLSKQREKISHGMNFPFPENTPSHLQKRFFELGSIGWA